MSNELTAFFTRLLQPTSDLGIKNHPVAVDDVDTFERAWVIVQATLVEPDERMLLRGISTTDVPEQLEWMINAMVFENENVQGATGSCTEYFLNNDVLNHLVRLSLTDRPFGIKSEVIRSITTLLISLPPSMLLHTPIHQSLSTLLRSCIVFILHAESSLGDSLAGSRVLGAAATAREGGEGKEMGERVEEDLVDLICVAVSRIRDLPPLLLIFFPTPTPTPTSPEISTPTPLESLLFTFLLRHIHRESRVGSFARTGILALLDICLAPLSSAAASEARAIDHTRFLIARNVLGGLQGQRFADLLAAGLGAIYSVLPFKLRLPTSAELNGIPDSGGSLSVSKGPKGGEMYLGLHNHADDDYVQVQAERLEEGLESVCDEAVERQLGVMKALMGFTEEILQRCEEVQGVSMGDGEGKKEREQVKGMMKTLGEEIQQTIRISFLKGVIYPAVIECSTSDGSAVAVLSYIRQFVANPKLGSLAGGMVRFLMGFEAADEGGKAGRYTLPVAKFTLKDLILDALAAESASASAGVTGLNLLQELVGRFCRESTVGLIGGVEMAGATGFCRDVDREDTEEEEDDVLSESGGQVEQSVPEKPPRTGEIGLQASFMAENVNPQDPDADLYSELLLQLDDTGSSAKPESNPYLTDGYTTLCSDSCFQAGLANLKPGGTKQRLQHTYPHRLESGEPMLQALLLSLRHFFEHTAEYNVALTGAISAIGNCPCRSVEGWLTRPKRLSRGFDPGSPVPGSVKDELKNPFTETGRAALPALYQTLKDLARQVGNYRSQVQGFDKFLVERRKGLLFVAGMEDAMNMMLDVVPSGGWTPQRHSPANSPPPKRPTPVKLASSLVSFLTPKKKSTGPEDSPSPFSFRTAFSSQPQEPAASPYEIHYRRTTSVPLDPLVAEEVQVGPWSPPKHKPARAPFHHSFSASSAAGSSPSEDLRMEDKQAELPKLPPKQITLSLLLDNCVVLEEFIKECVSKIVVRRTLGIDGVDAGLSVEE